MSSSVLQVDSADVVACGIPSPPGKRRRDGAKHGHPDAPGRRPRPCLTGRRCRCGATPAARCPVPGVSCTAMNGSAQSATTWQPPLITVPAGQPLAINLVNNLTFALAQHPNFAGDRRPARWRPRHGPGAHAEPGHAPQGTTWPGTPGAGQHAYDVVFTPPLQADRVRSFGTEVAAGASRRVCWGTDCPRHGPKAPLRPGTYIIHSGTQPSIQHPMGLYGVLVVTEPSTPPTPRPTARRSTRMCRCC